jgi:uncharacterized membrane protein
MSSEPPESDSPIKKETAASENEVMLPVPEILEKLPLDIKNELLKVGGPDEANKIIRGVVGVVVASRQYQGPLPLAEEFSMYERTLPGAAHRIMQHMEEEQRHRHSITERMVTNEIADTTRGQYFGFAIIVMLIFGAFFCIYKDNPWGAASFLSIGALGAASKFIDGRDKDKKKKSD